MKSQDLRPGMAIRLDGQLWLIITFQHVTPGNLRAFISVKIKNLNSGSIVEKRLRSGEDIEQVNLDRRDMEFLYRDSTGFVFMDQETFEQETIHEDLLGDSMLYVKPNTVIKVLMADGKPVSLELPGTVDLVVTETTPGIKGATVTNVMKEALMETGLKTRVPQFISEGELVRIGTSDGSYQSRA